MAKQAKLTPAERAELTAFLKDEVSKGRPFRAMLDRSQAKFNKISWLVLLKAIMEILAKLST